jgi:hypothetical protein
MNIFFTRTAFLFIIYFTAQIAVASNVNPRYPKLIMHGNSYNNSCAPVQRKELMRKIEKNVLLDKVILQAVVDLILCGSDTPQNTTKIAASIAEVVTTNYEGTAEERIIGKTSDKIEVAKDLMAKGRAWSSTLQFNDDEVTLQFFSNEACVESVKLRHSKNLWVVYEIGEACD